MEDADTDTISLYAVLNVGREATQEEITKAYRRLATVFHPDKHVDPQLRQQAQESFAKIQEAYEVLSDPTKRAIYDVYGKQGLAAGLEVGDHLRSREELKRQWEEFQTRMEAKKAEQAVAQKGYYQFRIDARPLLAGRFNGASNLIKSVTAQSALDSVVGERNVVSVSGNAAVRSVLRRLPNGRAEELPIGGGTVLFGYKRLISDDDSLDIGVQYGLQSLLSLTSTRRLDRQTGRDGWVTLSWQPQAGAGLQLGCSQNLGPGSMGSCSVVLGPPQAVGITTTVTKRNKTWSIQGRLEVGVVTSIQARLNVVVGGGVTLRLIGRLGTTGIDVELGANKRFTPQLSGYVGTCVGIPAGVTLKTRVVRANQVFECPIVLSAAYTDWQLALAAHIVPPLLYVATMRLVVRPALAWARSKKDKAAREQAAESLHAVLDKAQSEQALIASVAARKVASESALPGGGGLIILEAAYGILDEYHASQQQQQQQSSQQPAQEASTSSTTAAGSSSRGAGEQHPQQQPQQQQEGEQAGPGPGSAQASTSQQQQGRGKGRGQPPAWLRVTLPLQYLVMDSKLQLAGGVPKAGLMGFADPAPHAQPEEKQLYVAYSFKGSVYEVVAGDTEAVTLPEAGHQLVTGARAALLRSRHASHASRPEAAAAAANG